MRGWSNAATYVGVALIGLGLLFILLGWNGAASFDTPQQQIPYLISGGLAGVAMVVGGVGLVAVQELRRTTMELSRRLDEIIDGLAVSTGPTAVPDTGEAVVAGRTTYHRPTCHLVEGRSDLQVMSPAAARDRGLAPCRVCEPEERTA